MSMAANDAPGGHTSWNHTSDLLQAASNALHQQLAHNTDKQQPALDVKQLSKNDNGITANAATDYDDNTASAALSKAAMQLGKPSFVTSTSSAAAKPPVTTGCPLMSSHSAPQSPMQQQMGSHSPQHGLPPHNTLLSGGSNTSQPRSQPHLSGPSTPPAASGLQVGPHGASLSLSDPNMPVNLPATTTTTCNTGQSGYGDSQGMKTSQGTGKLGRDAEREAEKGRSGVDSDGYSSAADSHGDLDEEDEGNRSGRDHGLGPNRLKMKRTAKQQMQNKQAQQRYRQRRKAKLVEMEKNLDMLTKKVSDLQGVQAKNHQLTSRNAALEQSLKGQEAEITRLRRLLASRAPGGAGTSSGNLDSLTGSLPSPRESEDIKQTFCESVEALKEFMLLCNLRQADPTGKSVAAHVAAECRQLVTACCRACMQAMSAETPCVLELILKDPAKMTPMENHIHRSRWVQTIGAMSLSEEQIEMLLNVRREQLRKLRRMYHERSKLHAQLLDMLTPDLGIEGRMPLDVALQDCLNNMSMHGYLYGARNLVEMTLLMEMLKDNMKAEQRLVMELLYMVIHHVLSPIQSALLFVDMFPFHCDVLAFLHALAFKAGDGSPAGSLLTIGHAPSEISESVSGMLSPTSRELVSPHQRDVMSMAHSPRGLPSLLPGSSQPLSLIPHAPHSPMHSQPHAPSSPLSAAPSNHLPSPMAGAHSHAHTMFKMDTAPSSPLHHMGMHPPSPHHMSAQTQSAHQVGMNPYQMGLAHSPHNGM